MRYEDAQENVGDGKGWEDSMDCPRTHVEDEGSKRSSRKLRFSNHFYIRYFHAAQTADWEDATCS